VDRFSGLFWKYAVAILNVFYLYDSMVTWAVRAHEGFRELNPVISELQQINPFFYAAFRLGIILLVNLIIWQIHLEVPESCESRWFSAILILGIALYTIPLAISIHIFV
jgi:hypothetical protein